MKHLEVGNVHGKVKLQRPSLGAHTRGSWSIAMATEPFFKASAMASHHLQRVPPWACCMPSQFAPSPKVQFAHWPPEEIIAGCSFLNVLSCHPNHSSSSYLGLILKYVGVFNHRHKITGPRGSDRPQGACFH